MSKQKVELTQETETLLVPLYSRARACEKIAPLFEDKKAVEILEQVDYDFSQLQVPRGSEITLVMRAKKLDEYTRAFLVGHPDGVILHLGCGLDSRILRVGAPQADWYDLDLPQVIALRQVFYEATDHYRMMPSSVTDLNWMDGIDVQGRPVFVIAEGLLMYLTEAEVKSLVLALQQHFPHCEFVFDAFSTTTAKRVKTHPSIRKTGAVVQWGIDDAGELENWGKGIQLKEEWFFTQSEDIDHMSMGDRFMFRIAGLFSAARKAHRILYYQL